MYSSILRKHKIPLVEDLLTAAFFDLVRCFRDWGTLEAALVCAQSRHGTRLHLPDFDDVWIELWPNLPLGEPDVRLTFLSNHHRVATMIVEAKLGAAKSGRDAAAGEEVNAAEGADPGPVLKNRDQLARYMASQATMQGFGGPQFLGQGRRMIHSMRNAS